MKLQTSININSEIFYLPALRRANRPTGRAGRRNYHKIIFDKIIIASAAVLAVFVAIAIADTAVGRAGGPDTAENIPTARPSPPAPNGARAGAIYVIKNFQTHERRQEQPQQRAREKTPLRDSRASRHERLMRDLAPLFRAIHLHETAGGRDYTGDGGESRGPFHIQRDYWTDAGGAAWAYYRHVRNPRICMRIMVSYWQRFCPDALRRRDYRALARVHNGGPNGRRLAATWRYWRKVKKHLPERM